MDSATDKTGASALYSAPVIVLEPAVGRKFRNKKLFVAIGVFSLLSIIAGLVLAGLQVIRQSSPIDKRTY